MPTIKAIIIEGLTEIGKKNNLSGLELEGFVYQNELVFVKKVQDYNKIKFKTVERSSVGEKVYKRLQEKRTEQLNVTLFNPLQLSILTHACTVNEVTLQQVGSCKRTREILDCRYQIYAILVLYLHMTIKSAGNLFYQDHSTVINGLKKHSDYIETDKGYLSKFIQLLTMLKDDHQEFFEGIDPTKFIKKYTTNDYIISRMVTFEKTRLSYIQGKNRVKLETELILDTNGEAN